MTAWLWEWVGSCKSKLDIGQGFPKVENKGAATNRKQYPRYPKFPEYIYVQIGFVPAAPIPI